MRHFKVNIPNQFVILLEVGQAHVVCREIGASIYGAMHQNVSIVDSIDCNECYWLLM